MRIRTGERRAGSGRLRPAVGGLLLWCIVGASPAAARPREMVRDFPISYCPVHSGKPVNADGSDVLVGSPARLRDELGFTAPGTSVVVTVSTCSAGTVLQPAAEIGLDSFAVIRASAFLASQIDIRDPSVPDRWRVDPFGEDDCYKAHFGESPFSRTVGTLYPPTLKPACGPTNPDCPLGDDFEDPAGSQARWSLDGAVIGDHFGQTRELQFPPSEACAQAVITLENLTPGADYVVDFDWRASGMVDSKPLVAVDIRPPGADFSTLAPCRAIDTRDAAGPHGGPALSAGAGRDFTMVGRCNIPPTAIALAVNVTVTGASAAGHLRLYPAGTPLPVVSSINYSPGLTRANNAVVSLSPSGAITVHCAQGAGSVHFILDVSGYFD